MLVDFGVEGEASEDFGNGGGLSSEAIADVVAGIEMAGFVGEFAASDLVDGGDLGAFGFEFFADGADEFVNAAFGSLGV